MKHLIIGNGAAGISAAQKLRELNEQDEITVLSAEDAPVYAKIMLPDYIGGKLDREKLFLRNYEYYKTNRIELKLNSKVELVDAENKIVHISDGRKEKYDRLLLAMGGKSFIPPIEGLDKVGYYSLNSLSDADNIKKIVAPSKKALIIGAGLTGIEVAFALKSHGMEVEILDKLERILPQQLDTESSLAMTGYLRKEGINLLLGKNLIRFEASQNKAAVLDNGERINFDVLVLAIGTRPDTGILNGTGVKCGRGVLVDEFLRSSDPDIFAAGDVCEAINKLSNEYVSCYIWPNAMAQGKCAAYNMSGRQQEFSSISVQASVQLRDIPFMSMGKVNASGEGYEVLKSSDPGNNWYKRLILKDNRIVSMVFLGELGSANTISGLIRKGIDVSGFKDRLLLKDLSLPG